MRATVITNCFKFTTIEIKNFKRLKNLTINFTDENDKPLPLIVIAGVNGSGKTTILDALGKFTKRKFAQISYNKFSRGIMFGYFDGANNLFTSRVFSDDGNLLEDRHIHSKNIFYFNIGHNYFGAFKDFFPKYAQEVLFARDIIASKLYKEIADRMDDIFKDMDFKITFSRIDGKTLDLIFKNKKGKEFLADELSTGEKALISSIFYLYILDLKNQVILIDEPETSLHPNWQNKILKLYEGFAIKNNCQIIIATHSPHIIGSAKNKYLRVLVDDENGNLKVIDNFSECYGLETSQVLTDIMGTEDLRTPDINKKFIDIHNMIASNEFDNDDFQIKWQELEDLLGKNYLDLKLLKLEIISRKKNV